MNSTKWFTLTEFVKYLGRTGQCKVDETAKGWFISVVHKDEGEVGGEEETMPNGNPILLWHFTIKFHYMLHIGNMAAFCNPRNAWCYAGASLMQRVRILVQSSCRGLPAHKLGEKCLKKYCLALGMTLSKEP